MNILDYLPAHIPICKQTFFLSEGENIDIGDVFYQDGSKLFVLRKNMNGTKQQTNNSYHHDDKQMSKRILKKKPFPKPLVKGFQSEGTSYVKHQSESNADINVEESNFMIVENSKAHDLGSLPTFLLVEQDDIAEESNKQEEESVVLDEYFAMILADFEQRDVLNQDAKHLEQIHQEEILEEEWIQVEELTAQFFEHFDASFFEDFDEDIESLNDFEDWLVIDIEILMKKDNTVLLNCYAMPFCFWDIVLESFLIYELEGYVPSVSKLIEKLKHMPPDA